MKNSRTVQGKILQHAEGMGVPSTDLVRRRAEEIALIGGRREFSEEDWQQAKQELHGGHARLLDDDGGETIGAATQREIPGTLGHHVENAGQEDTENVLEELVAEGMDEAVHEQMLEAARMEPRDEEV